MTEALEISRPRLPDVRPEADDPDVGDAYLARRRLHELEEARANAFRMAQYYRSRKPVPTEWQKEQRQFWEAVKAVPKYGGEAVAQTPRAIVRGVEQGLVNKPLQLIHDVGAWLNENLEPTMGSWTQTETGLEYRPAGTAEGEEPKERKPFQLPMPPEPSNAVASAISGISEFLAGFWGVGKLGEALKIPKAAGRAAEIAQAGFKGAVTDFVLADPEGQRLADLIAKVPALRYPIIMALSSKEDDTRWEARAKTALEGIPLGIFTDLGMIGLRAAVSAYRRSGGARLVLERLTGRKWTQPSGVGPDELPLTPVVEISEEDVAKLLDDPIPPKRGVLEVPEFEPEMTPEQIALAGRERRGIPVYHGTSADVTEFSVRHIGEGTGGAAQGWGLYFAQNPRVARVYQAELGGVANLRIGGRSLSEFEEGAGLQEMLVVEDILEKSINVTGTGGEIAGRVADDYSYHLREIEERITELQNPASHRHQILRAAGTLEETLERHNLDLQAATERFEILEWMVDEGIELGQRGNIYDVAINADLFDFLDLDKSIRDQSPQVVEKIDMILAADNGALLSDATTFIVGAAQPRESIMDLTGDELYKIIARAKGSKKAASETLLDAGIVGNKYLDEGSRRPAFWVIDTETGQQLERFSNPEEAQRWISETRRGEEEYLDIEVSDTQNLVVFDDSLVEITARNGEPVAGSEAERALRDLAPSGATPSISVHDGDIYCNWSRIKDENDIKEVIRDTMDVQASQLEEARRGVRTHAQTELSASQLDAWNMLMESGERRGVTMNAEESLAIRTLWVSSARKLKELAMAAYRNPSIENQFAFRRMLAIHGVIQRRAISIRTETARALNAWKIPAESSRRYMEHLQDILDNAGGDKVTGSLAKKITLLAQRGEDEALEKMVAGSLWAKTRDAVTAAWYFSLLSGPHTHLRNMISNTAVIGQQLYEREVAAMIGQALGEQNVAYGEAAAGLFATLRAFKTALRINSKQRKLLLSEGRKALEAHPEEFENLGTVWRSAATGETGIGIGKIEHQDLGPLSAAKWQLDEDSTLGIIMNWLDAALTSPGRALQVEDELSKTIGYERELAMLAHRKTQQAIRDGILAADDEIAIKEFTQNILENPDETARLAAMDHAIYSTFTGRVGPKARAIARGARAIPVLGRIIMPFERIWARIGSYAFERTPLAPLVKEWRDDIMAGGARADIAWARFVTGNFILAGCADLAMQGYITGSGPDSRPQRAHLAAQNIKPNSIRIKIGPEDDDYEYLSYRGLEPVATTLGISSNIVEILMNTDFEHEDKDMTDLIIAASMAIAGQVTSQQYMTGVSDFFEAMSDPKRYGPNYWRRLVGLTVPTGVAQIARIADPNARAVNGMIDSIKARTPFWSKTLPARHQRWGKEILYRSNLGSIYDVISPAYAAKQETEPIDAELERLEKWLGNPSPRASFRPEWISDLTQSTSNVIDRSITINLRRFPEAYERYKVLQGNELTERFDEYGVPLESIDSLGMGLMDTLNALVTGGHPDSPDYDEADDAPRGEKWKMIDNFVDDFRQEARRKLLLEFPELADEVKRRIYEQRGWQ